MKITNGSSLWTVIPGRDKCYVDDSLKTMDINRTLHQACENGDWCMVRYILAQKHADINTRGNNTRMTPVMVAARKAHVEIFYFLVSQGCNLSIVDVSNSSVLHAACISGSTDIVRKLLANKGFGVDSRGWNGWTPAMYAVMKGQKDVLELLVNKGCDLTAVTRDNKNILHIACMGGHVDMVKDILSEGLSIESRDSLRRTPVMIAAKMGHIDVFEFLVDKGCNVTAIDKYSNNILHTACIDGSVNMTKYILSNNLIGIESRGNRERTPVLWAAKRGRKETVELLLATGCDLRAKDNDLNNILHLACAGGNVNLVEYFLSKSIVPLESRGHRGKTPVMMAVKHGHKRVVDILVRKGCNLDALDSDHNNILHLACTGCHEDMVKYILSKKRYNIESKGFDGRTPLMLAAEFCNVQVVKLFVKKRCNLGVVDNEGNNVLHMACAGGNADVVRYLIKLGLVLDKQKNIYGQTPLQLADAEGQASTVRLLKAII